MKNAVIISAFAGVGKTSLVKKYPNIIDLESSDYKWIYYNKKIKSMNKEKRKGITKRTLNPAWPTNYLEEIKKQTLKYDLVLISQSKDIRNCLQKNKIKFYVFFPSKECKEEYIKRYIARGNNECFIKKINDNYDRWINDLEKEENKIILHSNENLEQILLKYKLIQKIK